MRILFAVLVILAFAVPSSQAHAFGVSFEQLMKKASAASSMGRDFMKKKQAEEAAIKEKEEAAKKKAEEEAAKKAAEEEAAKKKAEEEAAKKKAEEEAAKKKAEEEAAKKKAEEEAAKKAAEEEAAKKKAEEEAAKKKAEEEAAKKKAEEEAAKKKAEEEAAKKKAEEEAAKKAAEEEAAKKKAEEEAAKKKAEEEAAKKKAEEEAAKKAAEEEAAKKAAEEEAAKKKAEEEAAKKKAEEEAAKKAAEEEAAKKKAEEEEKKKLEEEAAKEEKEDEQQELKLGVHKLGLIHGPLSTNDHINMFADTGSWYYTYGPFPNRAYKDVDTLTMAKATNKEFVPMIFGPKLYRNDQYNSNKWGACFVSKDFLKKDIPLCDTDMVVDALEPMMAEFEGHVMPKHFMLQNEPWAKESNGHLWNGKKIMMTPKQAAESTAILQPAMEELGLKMVSPTVDGPLEWFSEYLEACLDQNGCDINQIEVFSIHKYICRASFWETNFVDKGFQNALLDRMKDVKKGGMSVSKWEDFIFSRKIWVTETSCNWDGDYANAENKGEFIRSNKETCERATGLAGGQYGSLPAMMAMTDDQIERVSWWVTHTDVSSTSSASQQDRSEAARMTTEHSVTPIGKVIKQASEDPTKLLDVNCNG